MRYDLTLFYFVGDSWAYSACWHQQVRTGACNKQSSLLLPDSGCFLPGFLSSWHLHAFPGIIHTEVSLINVNTPRCENYLLKQGCDSDVQEHFKSSGDHWSVKPTLQFSIANSAEVQYYQFPWLPLVWTISLSICSACLSHHNFTENFFPDLMLPLFSVFVQVLNVLIWPRACLLCPTGILCMLIQRWLKINILIDLP